jgi:phosphoribosyl-AMP cyclohydrolase
VVLIKPQDMDIDFKKGNGLVPVVIQDINTLQVLMVGYMNEEAYLKPCRNESHILQPEQKPSLDQR